jgi:hypothetical protein
MCQTQNTFVYIVIVKHYYDGIWVKYGIILKIQNVSLFNVLICYYYIELQLSKINLLYLIVRRREISFIYF